MYRGFDAAAHVEQGGKEVAWVAGQFGLSAPFVGLAVITTLLFVLLLVYVVNFIDRQILSILVADIKAHLGVSDAQIGFLYGTAFGVFNLMTGVALLAASALAGALWDAGGPRVTFLAGAELTALAVVTTTVLHATAGLPRRAAH